MNFLLQIFKRSVTSDWSLSCYFGIFGQGKEEVKFLTYEGVLIKIILKLFHKNVCNFNNLSCKISNNLVK